MSGPGLLEKLGSAAFAVAHCAFEQIERLPPPVSSALGLVGRVAGPGAALVERCTLDLLSYADRQVEWIMGTVETASADVLLLLSAAKDALLGKRFANYAAHLLVSYEIVVRNKADGAVNLVLQLPGLSSLAPLLLNVKQGNKKVVSFKAVKHEDSEDETDILAEEELTALAPASGAAAPAVTTVSSAAAAATGEISPASDDEEELASETPPAKLTPATHDEDELSRLFDASWYLGSPRRA